MGYVAPLTGFSGDAAAGETSLLPSYNCVAIDSFPKAAATGGVMKSDSGISYNLPIPRKRGRDHWSVDELVTYPWGADGHCQKNRGCNNYNFLGEDLWIEMEEQELDMDRLIAQHMEKVRREVEERGRRIAEAIEIGMMRILRSKEEEMEKMGKLNWELEERVNWLCMENEIWRDVAERNEASANALRSNLEQVLSEVPAMGSAAAECESCCGSNEEEEECEEMMRRRRKRMRGRKTAEEDRRCKNCWKQESSVLLLPCRHLCLCTLCASSLHTCPICNSSNNASLRVIMP